MLEHDLPAAPEILIPVEPDDPEDGDPTDIASIQWQPGEDGPAIVGWEVVAELVFEVDDEEIVYVNTATLHASVTQLTVPPEFVALTGLEGLVEAKVEVIAIAENGNKTITERVVFEAPEEEE
jgi:hypothetical protein